MSVTLQMNIEGDANRLLLTQNHQATLLAWAAEVIRPGGFVWPKNAHAIGVIDHGWLRAVVVLVQTYGADCDVHFASDGSRAWASRNVLAGLFGYAFLLRGVRRVQCWAGVSNTPCLTALRKAGFTEIGYVPGGMDDGEDAIMFSMLRSDCRWIKGRKSDG